jgi:cell division cycle 14
MAAADDGGGSLWQSRLGHCAGVGDAMMQDSDLTASVISGAQTRRNSFCSSHASLDDDCARSTSVDTSAACARPSQTGPAVRRPVNHAPGLPALAYTGAIPAVQTRPWRVGAIYSVVPGRLSFVAHESDQQTMEQIDAFPRKYFFSADFQERYQPYCNDFGPVNLGVVHAFCQFMRKYFNCQSLRNRELVYYTEPGPGVRTNCAFLLSAYLVIEHGYTPDQAWAPFTKITGNPFLSFRDATYCDQDYQLTIHACLQGLHKGMQAGWYNPTSFDAVDYDYLENPAHGDMHQVSPQFLAFKGPSSVRTQVSAGNFTFPPQFYLDVFASKGVTAVVRLNDASTYEASEFINSGLNHYDLYFADCTVPSNATVLKFIEICEKEKGVVAVHCQAGLGRTGTLIAAYMMRKHGFTASESIGWLRIVRPGSVIGPQQHYLHWLERTFQGLNRAGLGAQCPISNAPSLQLSSEQCETVGRQVAEAQAARAHARARLEMGGNLLGGKEGPSRTGFGLSMLQSMIQQSPHAINLLANVSNSPFSAANNVPPHHVGAPAPPSNNGFFSNAGGLHQGAPGNNSAGGFDAGMFGATHGFPHLQNFNSSTSQAWPVAAGSHTDHTDAMQE